MRKIMLALTLFALATPLFAKDPFAGTWKLNSEKSEYKAGAPPKEVTLVIEDQGTTIKYQFGLSANVIHIKQRQLIAACVIAQYINTLLIVIISER